MEGSVERAGKWFGFGAGIAIGGYTTYRFATRNVADKVPDVEVEDKEKINILDTDLEYWSTWVMALLFIGGPTIASAFFFKMIGKNVGKAIDHYSALAGIAGDRK